VDDSTASGGTGEDGVAALLYGMFTSFTEALDGFDQRMAAIEGALRAGPGDVARRLEAIEETLARAVEGGDGPGEAELEASLASLRAAVEHQGRLLDERTTAITTAVGALRTVLEAHVVETSHSLGRRAGEAGRRLASDLGLRRPRPEDGPSRPPGPGGPS
jgi:hypothetical protein